MKCINKRLRLLCLTGIAAVFMSGCGQTAVSYDNPYDVYATTADLGLSGTGECVEQTYFSENLCVATGNEDESSLNLTSKAAGSFDLASGSVDYAQNIFDKMYPASITKVMTALVTLKNCNLDETVTIRGALKESDAAQLEKLADAL